MNEDRKSLYVESTIPSYVVSKPSANIINAARQTITRLFWEEERGNYDLYISQYVIDECGRGDPEAAKKRLECLAGIPVYPKTAEIIELAAIYQKLLSVPDRAKDDCSHLATCVVQRIDYLLTWNCTHLGSVAQAKTQHYNEKYGLWMPLLVTPEELLAEKFFEEDL